MKQPNLFYNNSLHRIFHILVFLLVLNIPESSGQLNTLYGIGAGGSITTGTFNSIYGHVAGGNITTQKSNSFFGNAAGGLSTGSSNSFFGRNSGTFSTGSSNSFFGLSAGFLNTTGKENTFVGASSGSNNSTGINNVALGYQALQSNNTASRIVAVGSGALKNSRGPIGTEAPFVGSQNTAIGNNAGIENTTGFLNTYIGNSAGFTTSTGDYNTCIGAGSGLSNRTGSGNTFIGESAGRWVWGHSNIMIGYNAGPEVNASSISNKLYIDINDTRVGNSQPLIYGEFDNNFVKINGTFEVTAGLSNPSDVNLKNNFNQINEEEILEKISLLDLQQWTYIERPDELHIGATAQDFHAAFGLGADDKHISTIDADGVALAAIKALKKENDKLRAELLELKSIVNKMRHK